MAKLHYLVGKRASGTTGRACQLAGHYHATGVDVGVVTFCDVHAAFIQRSLPDASIRIYEGEPMLRMPTVGCILLDMVIHQSNTLLEDALERARDGSVAAVIVCVGHPLEVPARPSWVSLDDWHVELFSNYISYAPSVRRWISILNNTKLFQLHATFQGPGSLSCRGMGPFSFIDIQSGTPSSHISTNQISTSVTSPMTANDRDQQQSSLEVPKQSPC